LSNKIILTPVAPGNARGAVWSDKTLQNQNWIADVEFRASGPERGGGNLNIWLVRDGSHSVGSNSLYSVGRFEGLALVIDQHSGSGGMLRGFLNDGTTDYKHTHNVDSLAFGHCRFSYRNLGRPTQVKLRHNENKFSVEVAGRLCFESDKIRIPNGYTIGITASSSDNPDSFEVFKLAVLTTEASHEFNQASSGHQGSGGPSSGSNQRPQGHMNFGRTGQKVIEDPYDNAIPDEDADKITSSKAQFADLHNRLQSVNHHLTTIFRTIAQNAQVDEQRHAELSALLAETKGLITGRMDRLENILNRLDKIDVLEQRLRDVEGEMRATRHEIAGRLHDTTTTLKNHVEDKHETLARNVQAHVHGTHNRLLWVIIFSQCFVVAGYAYYKRKKTPAKKYL
jgi:mannose-binding lectin 1